MSAPNTADARAALAAAWEVAGSPRPEGSPAPGPVERLRDAPAPPGWQVWRVGGGAATMLPALRPSAPMRVRRRYLARIVASCTGRCPLCGAVAGLPAQAPDPERTPAGWAALPLAVGITHDESCAALFGPRERRWFDPRAVGEGR